MVVVVAPVVWLWWRWVAIGHITLGLYLERFSDFIRVNRDLTNNFLEGRVFEDDLTEN